MNDRTAKVDGQTKRLLDMNFWSNFAAILIIAGITAANMLRADAEQGALVGATSPQLVFIVSLALILWMGNSCIKAIKTKYRLSKVFITLDERGVTGYAMEDPMGSAPGQAFTLAYGDIQSVEITDVAITKKNSVPSLTLSGAEKSYVVPAPEGLHELIEAISDRMGGR